MYSINVFLIKAMKIILNNRDEYFRAEVLTVSELLKLKNFTFKMLVIKVNGKIIKDAMRDSTTIHDGDDVTVLHLVSGG
jgi:thiamine biosynthesis protein ThiS